MKNMKIKLTFIVTLILMHISMLILVSCGPSAEEKYAARVAATKAYEDSVESAKKSNKNSAYLTESVFIIDDIRADQSTNFMQYHASLSDNTTLGNASFWFRANANKYKLGDPLILKGLSGTRDTITNNTVNTVNKINK